MRNYKGDGNLIALTTPAAIATGAGLLVGGFFGITCKPAGAGEVVECLRAGEFTVVKNSAEAWAVGDTIYWDDTAKLFTAVVASNKQVGFAAAVAANPSATGIVQLVPMAGNVARFGFTGGNVTGLVGPDGTVIGNMTLRMGSGLPFVMPSSGSVNNTSGAITATTAFDYVIGPSYSYFPVGALYAASPAGWYYTNWTAASLATVYANTYTNGKPTIPTSPTPLTTVAGAYTQATGADVLGPSYIIPADFMLANGWIEWNRIVNNNNSAGAKYYNTFLGASTFQGLSQTTNPKEAGSGMLRNRGRKTAQVAANASHGDSNNASSITKLTIDTAQAQVFAFACYLAVATDYAIIESHSVTVNRVE